MINDNRKDNSVYIISMLVIAAIVIWGLLSPEGFGSAANSLFNFLIQNFGWGTCFP